MKKLTDLKNWINEDLSDIEKQISNCKKKLEDNYIYAFQWGYSEELFSQTLKLNTLKDFIDFIVNNPERIVEWLEHNIKRIEDKLLNNNLNQFSTNRSSNIAFELTIKVEQDLRVLYKQYLKQLSK
ncbi:MAG: hypothetical protein LC112_13910 [Flavobacteriales bacterium]|nr:hypothetical protein [Flavobacteriales bacterium]